MFEFRNGKRDYLSVRGSFQQDFSDWRPSTVFDSKRIKKENPEKERDKEKAKEKSLKQESPPDAARRRHTPSTYPRTKVSAATPVAERKSLERLKQQLNFSDQDEVRHIVTFHLQSHTALFISRLECGSCKN